MMISKKITGFLLGSILLLASCGIEQAKLGTQNFKEGSSQNITGGSDRDNIIDDDANINIEVGYFAGGCFWCIESVMDGQEGVVNAVSGYAGGTGDEPNYQLVSSGKTDYREAVKVEYDSSRVSYTELLDLFFRQIDPLDEGGQFSDRGFHYTTAIFYVTDAQRDIANNFIKQLNTSGKFDSEIVTKVIGYTNFTKAEEYHQDYALKQSSDYKSYKVGSGRAGYIEDTWENDENSIGFGFGEDAEFIDSTQVPSPSYFLKPSEEELREILTDIQYRVTQESGTEKAFDNEYHDNNDVGIYVDIVDGSALFSSTDKFDSATGWPSFTRPIDESMIVQKEDRGIFSVRTEVRSSRADSHLGHVFTDGPTELGGLRYCINSAALDFIPIDELESRGYGEYMPLFESSF